MSSANSVLVGLKPRSKPLGLRYAKGPDGTRGFPAVPSRRVPPPAFCKPSRSASHLDLAPPGSCGPPRDLWAQRSMPAQQPSASTSGVSTPKTVVAPSLHTIDPEDLPGGGLPPPECKPATSLPPGLPPGLNARAEPVREAPRRAGSGSRLGMWGISPDEAEEPDATLGALGVGGMLGVNAPDGVASLGGSLAHLGFCEQRPDAAQSPSRLASWCNGDEPSSSGGASSAPQLPAAIL